jgi:hypothetical protein
MRSIGARAEAELVVPGLTFTKEFQPELLTPVTKGVIEDVRGEMSGQGRIAWDADGVRSTGDFGTEGIDLAAALGPVTGIAGKIHFTDLLALESAPGQVVTIRTINPGIQVTNGTIRYQTLSARIRVESGNWPFAGGTLTSTRCSILAAGGAADDLPRQGRAADQFQFDFQTSTPPVSSTANCRWSSTSAAGGSRAGGWPCGRAGIAYLGRSARRIWDSGAIWFRCAPFAQLSFASDRHERPLAGEMVTDVRFAGISQGKGAKSNFLIRRLQKLPFVFNVRIKAPFRGLLDLAQSFYDPRRLIQRNLPALLEEQNKRAAPPAAPAVGTPIQRSASETVP